MINTIANRIIAKHTTPAIEIITWLLSPRMEGELENTIMTVSVYVGSEEDVDKDINGEVDEQEDINLT